ncbi:MAG: GxxExxY protein [Betaproteobacteria bacterium]|nr:GxxExxY protein [Betaproteobacteria bacterium]
MHQEIPQELNVLASSVVDAAFKIHTVLGPGLLESAYQGCLEIELGKRGVAFASQCLLPIRYEGVVIKDAYRIDLLVSDRLVVELKSVEQLLPIHSAQLLTYLRLSGNRLGLLINFNAPRIKDGIKRIAL